MSRIAILFATLALTGCEPPMSNEDVDAQYIACEESGKEAHMRRNTANRVYEVVCIERLKP